MGRWGWGGGGGIWVGRGRSGEMEGRRNERERGCHLVTLLEMEHRSSLFRVELVISNVPNS